MAIPQDDGDDDNPNDTCNFVLIGQKIRENSGFVILELVVGYHEQGTLSKRIDIVYGRPTIPQDDGDDDNPNETMCVYFFLPLYAAFIIFLSYIQCYWN